MRKRTLALPLAVLLVLLVFPTWAAPEKEPQEGQELAQVSNDFLTRAGAKPVDCGMGSDFGFFVYIGCGKMTTSLDEFQARINNEFASMSKKMRNPLKLTRDWVEGDLNGIPTRGTTWDNDNMIVSVEVSWPLAFPIEPTDSPIGWKQEDLATVYVLWMGLRDMTETEKQLMKDREEE